METATKTIASFEALTPELSAPQGTLETDLGLPASLNAQFSDGVAGEIPVTWQCAAGYDPNAAAGGQFAFAAVLVTLTPPLANAMLMAETRDTDWTLSEDGKLTVTGYVMSSTIDSFESDVKSIEVIGTGQFTLVDGMSFSGDIYALEQDSFFNNGTITGGNIVGKMTNAGKITGGIISGDVVNSGEIIDGTFPGAVSNRSSITGGDFRGAIVVNESGSTITGGDFTSATVKNIGDATVTGGTFSNVAFDSTSGELTDHHRQRRPGRGGRARPADHQAGPDQKRRRRRERHVRRGKHLLFWPRDQQRHDHRRHDHRPCYQLRRDHRRHVRRTSYQRRRRNDHRRHVQRRGS